MEELLANPAVQAAVAPFLLPLAAAVALRQTRLLGLAVVLAFAVVVALTVGYSFESLTATRKMILVGLASAIALTALELRNVAASAAIRAALAAGVGAAAVWMLWRVLQQQEASRAVLHGAAAALYAALLLESSLRGDDGVSAAASSLILGLAAGSLALLGASALLAQIGIAVGAGAGAVLLVQVAGLKRGPAGWTLVLPAATICGLVGLLAVFTGSLPWFCLLPTLAIPWVVRLARRERHAPWLAAVLTSLAGAVPLLLAVGLAWYISGPST
jgi:hypothetical protein